jgi:hypothetical protein
MGFVRMKATQQSVGEDYMMLLGCLESEQQRESSPRCNFAEVKARPDYVSRVLSKVHFGSSINLGFDNSRNRFEPFHSMW